MAKPGTTSDAVRAAMDFAEQHLGDPYVYGSTGPDSWDCSGLMLRAWTAAGVTLPRTSADQSTFGTKVDPDALSPGDLIFYYTPVSHVGMYIGNGQIIHAPHTGDVVKVAPYDEMPITVIRRVADLATAGAGQ